MIKDLILLYKTGIGIGKIKNLNRLQLDFHNNKGILEVIVWMAPM